MKEKRNKLKPKEKYRNLPDIIFSVYPAVLLCVLFFLHPLQAQNSWYKETAFSDGEWLKYKVKWGFIRLGTLEIFQTKIKNSSPSQYKIEMRAKSANLPFIDVFFVNKGILDPNVPTLQTFRLESGREKENITTYIYHPEKKTIFLETRELDEVIRTDSIYCLESVYDALGVFMMMRCLSASGFNITLNNIVDFSIRRTGLKFTGEVKKLKVDAFDKSIDAIQLEGNANWEGKAWAGVTGAFKGWISHDQMALPIKVNIKIFLGSISLELEECNRVDIDKKLETGKLVTNLQNSTVLQ